MKIQLDFDNKNITLEKNINLKEFYDKIKQVLPDWKEWSLNTNNIINWSYPYYVRDWERPYIWYNTNNNTDNINRSNFNTSGIVSLEI